MQIAGPHTHTKIPAVASQALTDTLFSCSPLFILLVKGFISCNHITYLAFYTFFPPNNAFAALSPDPPGCAYYPCFPP